MKQLSTQFIPVTAHEEAMQFGRDREALLYQKFMEQGHREGIPTGGWQGCYVVAPNGVLLAHLHVGEYSNGAPKPGALEQLLKRGLEKWQSLPSNDRLLPAGHRKELETVPSVERFFPNDGLVLHEYARDLPHEHPPEYYREKVWREVPASQWNQDFVWFTKSEAAQFLPARLQNGQKHEIPQPLVERIACLHLRDYRFAGVYEPQRLRLISEVTAVKGTTVGIRVEGETRAVGYGDQARKTGRTPAGSRSMETRLLGKATYDRSKGRFTQFELVALGTRWHDKENHPLWDPGPAPTGFLFTLAGDGPAERLAPSRFDKYGWHK